MNSKEYLKEVVAVVCALFLSIMVYAQEKVDVATTLDPRTFQADRLFTYMQQNQTDRLYAMFATEVRSQITEQTFDGVFQQTEAMAGAFKSREAWEERTIMGTPVYASLIHFEKMDLGLIIAFNEKLQVLGLQFVPATMLQTEPAQKLSLPEGAVETIDTLRVSTQVQLPLVLTLPAGATSATPVVVMVHGSGPLDRDETVAVNKPFRDLAYQLAAQGIATLRYDKRTFVYRDQRVENMDDETVTDALCALTYAHQRNQRVLLLGHSLGGMMAPIIASRTDVPLQGIIMMAAPARNLEQVVRQQLDYLRPANAPATYAEDALELLRTQSPHYLQPYGQVEAAQLLPVRMLFLQGERDYQVPMIDFRLWRQILGNRPAVTFHSYPKLNHLFLEGEGDSTPLEYSIEGHVPAYVVENIATFCR